MKVYTTIQRGYQHKHFCEDFFLATANENWFFGVVSDGCSSGLDSHFASALTCKLLKKQIRALKLSPTQTAREVALMLLHNFMADLHQTAKTLDLEILELLATLLLVVHDADKNVSFIVALGDGAIAIDDQIYEIDQDNTPNYPAFYLAESKESLDIYFLKHYFEATNAKQIAIATDGVFSFNNERINAETDKSANAHYLLVDDSLQNINNMLNRKINILQLKQNLSPADDIAIVRLIFS